MRTLTLHFPDPARPTWDTFRKQTQEARLFRRAQAVRAVVQGQRLHTVSDSLHFPSAARRQWVHRFANQGVQGWRERPRPGRPPTGTCALAHHLARLVDQAPRPHGSRHAPWSGQALAPGLARQTGRQLSRARVRARRPTGRRAPHPAARAWASLALAALEYRARRGASIVLSEEATVLGRFALPRAGWGRTAPRARLPTRPLSQRHIRRDESLQRQAWVRSRSWSRLTNGGWLRGIGAVQYGTSTVFSQIVPHVETEGLRPYSHQVMALFRHTGTEVVMVADRRGLHRATQRVSPLTHWHEPLRWHLLPAHCGQHLHPLEGFWRVLKDRMGAGRCWPDLHQLSHRTRRVLMEHQARPISAFHW